MANNTEIKLVITSDGAVAIEQLGRTRTELSRFERDTASLGSKIRGHWLGISAAIASAGLLMRQAWGMADMYAAYAEQREYLSRLAAHYDTTATSIISSLQQASNGLISMSDLMSVATDAMSKGLRPEQLRDLASAAIFLSDVAGKGQNDAEVFRNLTEAIVIGRDRQMKSLVGIIDLNTKFTDQQILSMSQTQIAHEKYLMVMERVKRMQQEIGDTGDSTADKMRRLTVAIEDLRLKMGAGILRAAALLTATFYGLAAAIYDVRAALASFNWGSFSSITMGEAASNTLSNMKRLLKNPKELLTGIPEEFFAGTKSLTEIGLGMELKKKADEYAAKAREFLEIFNATNEEIARATGPLAPMGEAMSKVTNNAADALADFRARVDQLNPSLDEYERKLAAIYDQMWKIAGQYPQLTQALINESARAEAYINAARAAAQAEQVTEILKAQATYRNQYADAVIKYDAEILKFRADAMEKRMLAEDEAALKLKDAALAAAETFEDYAWQEVEITRITEERKTAIRRQAAIQRERDELESQARTREAIAASLTSGGQYAEGLAPGLAALQAGAIGMMNIAQGQDPYSLELERLRLFWEEKINLYIQGNATIEEVEAARYNWSQAAAMKEALTKITYAQFAAQSIVGLGQMLYVASGSQSAALFYLVKAASTAQAVVNAWLAYTYALATPFMLPGAREAYAHKVLALGLAGAAAIAATAFMGAPGAAGAGGGATGVGTYGQPAVTTPAQPAQATQQQRPISLNITVLGHVIDSSKFARELAPAIREALEDRA